MLEEKLCLGLQERFQGIVEKNDKKKEKIDNLIVEAAKAGSEDDGGKKKGKSKKGRGKAKAKADEAKIASNIADISAETDAVRLTDVIVKKVWTRRKTPTRFKQLQIADPAIEEVTTIPVNDGPLAFVYEDVFSVLVTGEEDDAKEEPEEGKPKKKAKKEKEKEFKEIMLFFYGKWAIQMDRLVAKGDQLTITVPSPNIQENGDKDPSHEDEHDLCIAIGSETTADFSVSKEDPDKENTKKAKKGKKSKEPVAQTFALDEDTQVKVVSFPRAGVSGATARTVEVGIDSENVGTIERQQFEEINPFNQKKRVAPIVDEEFAKKAKVATYDYTDLATVVKLASDKKKSKDEKRVNVYGVVVSFAPPRQTIRGDWLSPVTLTDDSLKNGKVIMNVFHADATKLPAYMSIGDVVRCHRVHAQVYEYDVDAFDKKGKPTGKKETVIQPQLVSNKASSFIVISRQSSEKDMKATLKAVKKEKGGLGVEWMTSSTSKMTLTFTEKDAKRMRALWAWGLQSFSEGSTIIRNPNEKDATFTISSMIEEIDAPSAVYPASVKGDLTCLVTAVIGVAKDKRIAGQPFGFLRVWDGTGAPKSDPLPLDSQAAHHALSTGDPGVDCMNAIKAVVDNLPKCPTPPSLCGRVVNVAVWEAAHWEYINNGWMAGPAVVAGDWIRIRNVWDGSMGGDNLPIRMLHMGDRAGMTPLNDSVFEVKELVIAHNKRVSGKDKFNPNSCVYGENSIRAASTAAAGKGGKKGKGKGKKAAKTYHCLAEVLGEPAPSEFTVKARIVGTYPSVEKEADLTKLCVMSVPSKKMKKSEPMYQFAIQLEDNTAELSAIISGDAAESILKVKADKIGGKKKPTAAVKKQVLETLDGIMDDTEFEVELQSFMQGGEKFVGVKKDSKVEVVKKDQKK